MRMLTVILLSAAMIVAAFILGFYVALNYINQLAVFGSWANLIPVFTPIGVALAILKLIVEWRREPTLEFGEITVNNEPAYFIAVKKKGPTIARKCEGWLKVRNDNIPGVWALNEVRVIDIADEMPLRLFRVENENSIVLSSAHVTQGRADNPVPYGEYIDIEITIKIGAEYGRAPKPIRRTIREIIDSATNH
jgi:hypothetical protein